jgi:FkbM family methyltransferase
MTTNSLAVLLSEPLESVMLREQTALENCLRFRGNRVVLFGSGNLGRQALKALRSIGILPLCFSDNNEERWGKNIDDLEVMAPKEAAAIYGEDSTFLVTIWNPFHWFNETALQLQSYGCSAIASYVSLHWRFPELFLPAMLNDSPHKVYPQRDKVLAAAELWSDVESRKIYEANIRFRVLGEMENLPGRPSENTYFPLDILRLENHDRFLDCGATCGEMTQDLLQKRGRDFELFCALEADNISFPKLQAFCHSLPIAIQSKLKLFDCAVGRERATVHFAHSGETGSRISSEGQAVDCFPIDELFATTPLTFIKMDIEGAEYDALLGAAKVIARDRPILAICAYHTQNDIWRIPLLVHETLPKHRLFLRAYEGDGFQTVMYAVPPERCL